MKAGIRRWLRVLGVAAALGGLGLCGADIEAQAGTTPASSIAMKGTDASTGSAANSTGTVGTTAPGHTIDWVVHYANTTGAPATVKLTDAIGANQSFVPGSLSVPSGTGLAPQWSTDGGSSWVTAEPGSGVNAVGATGTMAPGGLGATSGAFSTYSAPAAGFTGAGDGWEDTFYKGNVYNLHHQWGRHAPQSGVDGLIDCHVVASGAECPAYAGGGLNADSTAGTAFFARSQSANADFISPFFPNPAFDRSTGKLYFPTTLDGSSSYGIGCLDLANDTSCGFTKLGNGTSISTDNTGDVAGGAQIGHRYYVLDSTGTIDCYDYATASTCGTYTAFSTPGNVLAGAEDRVESFDGRYLFAEMGNKSGVHAYISCVDLSTGNRCPGYPFTASVTNNLLGQTSLEFLPVLNSSRAVTGVCIAAMAISTASSNTSYQCVDTSANPISNPYPIPAGSAPSHATFGTVLVLGTRAYYPQITYKPTTHTIQYECYDFAPGAPCAGFSSPAQTSPYTQGAPGNQPGNLTPYTLEPDPDLPGCVGEIGDTGVVQYFDARTGALGCSGSLGKVSVDPTASYCDGQSGHVTGWDQVVISGIPPADYKGATVTVLDADGNLIPGFEAVPLSSGQSSLDISSIPVSGSTSKLSVMVTVATPSAGATPQVSLTFKGDPAQICFKTTVGAAQCVAQSIANDATAITSGSNGVSDAPGGTSAGAARFTEAGDPSTCGSAGNGQTSAPGTTPGANVQAGTGSGNPPSSSSLGLSSSSPNSPSSSPNSSSSSPSSSSSTGASSGLPRVVPAGAAPVTSAGGPSTAVLVAGSLAVVLGLAAGWLAWRDPRWRRRSPDA